MDSHQPKFQVSGFVGGWNYCKSLKFLNIYIYINIYIYKA
jgi:hypothetical protein